MSAVLVAGLVEYMRGGQVGLILDRRVWGLVRLIRIWDFSIFQGGVLPPAALEIAESAETYEENVCKLYLPLGELGGSITF